MSLKITNRKIREWHRDIAYFYVGLIIAFSFSGIILNHRQSWYSDIFGVAIIVIAVTGMLIPAGKFGFGQRGWKYMLVGLVFPLVFLLFY